MKNAVFWNIKTSDVTSQETHYFSTIEPSPIILCSI
jgi:hypothetical protein